MLGLEDKSIQWLVFLFGTVTFSVLGVLFPNRYKQLANPRAHNGVKLLNECLARHQLAYFAYFFALAIAARFNPEHDWVKSLTQSLVVLSLIFYAEGVYSSTVQDRSIAGNHDCPNDITCTTNLPTLFCVKLYSLNVLFAIVSLAAGLWVAKQVR